MTNENNSNSEEAVRPLNEEVLSPQDLAQTDPLEQEQEKTKKKAAVSGAADDSVQFNEDVQHITKKAVSKDEDPSGLSSDEKMNANHEKGTNY